MKLYKIAFFLLLFMMTTAAQPAAAAVWTVTKTADTNDGACSADCSLREAVAAAGDNDQINFQADLSGGTITLNPLHGWISISRDITINGIDGLKISGGGKVRLFSVINNSNVTMKNLDLGNGSIDYQPVPYIGMGGAIYLFSAKLKLEDCYVHNNKAAVGGGAIFVNNNSELETGDSFFAANTSSQAGGAIYAENSKVKITKTRFNLNSATNGSGGALYQGSGTLEMIDSSIYKSSAKTGGALYLGKDETANYVVKNSSLHHNAAQSAGGIYNAGTLNFTNSTLSTNKATVGDGGGLVNAGMTTMRNATVTLNSAAGNGGGLSNQTGGVYLGNTIAAGNSNANNGMPNLKGIFVSSGYNLFGPAANALVIGMPTGNQFNVADPLLMPLADNGGATLSHLPLPNSPAIDAGANALAVDEIGNPLPTDQRGSNRVNGRTVDVGAVEVL